MTETPQQLNIRQKIVELYNRVLLENSPQLRACRHLVSGQRVIRPWRHYGSAIAWKWEDDEAAIKRQCDQIEFTAKEMARIIEDHLHGRNTANESLDVEDKAGLVCLTVAPRFDLKTRKAEPKVLFTVLSESPRLGGSTMYFVGAQFSTLGEGR